MSMLALSRRATSCGVLAGLFCLASASAHAESATLSWDACAAGVQAKSFACNSNLGQARMVVSAVRDAAPTLTQGFRCSFEVAVDAASLPAWWQLQQGGCRASALAGSAAYQAGDSACQDSWGSVLFLVVQPTAAVVPGRLGIVVTGASPTGDAQIVPGTETFIAGLELNFEKTSGTGICAGCPTRACVLLHELTIFDSGGVEAPITVPEPTSLLGWQTTPGACRATPARNHTWGRIKELYR